ncbi:hypothetical protein ACT453_30875, partial [Bacillus sp. D-CC]
KNYIFVFIKKQLVNVNRYLPCHTPLLHIHYGELTYFKEMEDVFMYPYNPYDPYNQNGYQPQYDLQAQYQQYVVFAFVFRLLYGIYWIIGWGYIKVTILSSSNFYVNKCRHLEKKRVIYIE